MNHKIRKYKEEENILLETCLSKRFFNIFQNSSENNELWKVSSVEIFITSTCNLECTYCYLMNYGDILYPEEIRDRKNIIRNITILLEWFIKKSFCLNELELFSGEIWHMNYGFEVLDVIYNAISNGLDIKSIMIPTNCSFALYNDRLDQMQEYIDKFNIVGCKLIISCSIEGLPLEDFSRPMKTGEIRDDMFYDRLFKFASKNGFLFHPMVSSYNVDKWIENYKWFEKTLPKYNFNLNALMLLEVRNNDWHDESIAGLINFFEYLIDKIVIDNKYDMDKILYDIFSIGTGDKNASYLNIGIPKSDSTPPCSISSTLTVRAGDLSIIPCHRLSYNKLIYGKFIVEDDNITKIESNNTQLPIKILYSNTFASIHGCDSCTFKKICMKGCYGEQFEDHGELYVPNKNVCKMLKSKYIYLIKKYIEIGLLSYMAEIDICDSRYVSVQEILILLDEIISSEEFINGMVE